MKIAMLVSGGVDSSVALRLLKEAGHDIVAFYLKIWLEDEMSFLGECPWEEDLSYVEKVCRDAGVPLEVVPFQKEYWERIVSYAIDEVKAGRTPNPDVLCNTRVKFGAFYEYLMTRPDDASFDKIASGHYAQTEEVARHSELVSESRRSRNEFGMTRIILKRSPDPVKDQTYFLSQMTREQVARAMFPIGHLRKSEVRKLAEQFDLPNAKRADSQGLCFLGKIRFDKFLEFHLGKRAGDLIDFESGKKLGEHDGFWYYTIGQRRGIHLSGGPWYVVKKDVEKNIVYISNSYRSENTARDTFEVSGLNWIADKQSTMNNQQSTMNEQQDAKYGMSCHTELVSVSQVNITRSRNEFGMTGGVNLQVKVRHGALMYPCGIEWLSDDRIKVKIDGADTGIAAGQFAVFYSGEYCLGGGTIVD